MFTLNCHGHLLSANMPVVMGIINTTPDSFHDSSRKAAVAEIVQEAELMLHEGADILDIGGQDQARKGVLLSACAMGHNVLKIRPPLVLSLEQAGFVIDALDESLVEAKVACAR